MSASSDEDDGRSSRAGAAVFATTGARCGASRGVSGEGGQTPRDEDPADDECNELTIGSTIKEPPPVENIDETSGWNLGSDGQPLVTNISIPQTRRVRRRVIVSVETDSDEERDAQAAFNRAWRNATDEEKGNQNLETIQHLADRLSVRRRHKGESLTDYYLALKLMMVKPYPKQRGQLVYRIIKEIFVKGLDDGLACKVQAETPATLRDAYLTAMKEEQNQKSLLGPDKRGVKTGRSKEAMQPSETEVNTPAYERERDRTEDLGSSVEELQDSCGESTTDHPKIPSCCSWDRRQGADETVREYGTAVRQAVARVNSDKSAAVRDP